jgi:hypothetical protein
MANGLPTSIIYHPFWPKLRPHIVIEVYDRDGSARDPRIRIEVRNLPDKLRPAALAMQVCCANKKCTRPINPIRARKGPAKRGGAGTNLYYAAACELDVDKGCSRTNDAKTEYKLVRADVERWQAQQRRLAQQRRAIQLKRIQQTRARQLRRRPPP